MSKIISPPQSGRVGPVVYVNGRYGQIVRQYVCPRNPKTPTQQANRSGFGQVSSGWRALSPAQRIAWCIAAWIGRPMRPATCAVCESGFIDFARD